MSPPHKSVREERWSWVAVSFFVVGISKFKTITKIKIKKQDQKSHVVGV